MSDALPPYYFRVREPGAAVFRVDAENRQRRIEMEPIAVVNARNGNVRANGERTLTPEDAAAIREWLDARRALLARREVDDAHRLADAMNGVAHWAQAQATDAQVEAVADALLMAMHDLRSVLVRRKAEALSGGA